MSANDEHTDNYDRAYGDDAAAAPLAPTPEHGYWRSLAELDGQAHFQRDPARAANEFPAARDGVDPLSRRNFFRLMGSSMALAGVATGCRYEKEEIVPLARRPEGQVPGQSQEYATACEIGGVGHALVATSFEGRPIKLDGNALHPFASGAIVRVGGEDAKRIPHAGCSTFAQASLLDLYDPDRSQGPLHDGAGTTIDGVRTMIGELARNPSTVTVLCEATRSPTLRRLRNSLTSKGVRWHEYEPLSWDNERLGMQLAFGQPVRPLARLHNCETIVTIDCDLFVEHPAAARYSRDFAQSRSRNGLLPLRNNGQLAMNRLWSIEPSFTHTGAMADHRLALRAEHGLPVAMYLDAALGGGAAPSSRLLSEPKVKQFLDVLLEELRANAGKAVVIAGRRQPPAVHALVARINAKIGAPNATLGYVNDTDVQRPSHLESIAALARDMEGRVKNLIIIGGNPAYDAPHDLQFATKLRNVPNSLHLCEYVNETSLASKWHVPRAHFLETWGDTTTWDGTITLAQPLLAPLYGGISAIELLSMLDGKEQHGEELVKASYPEAGAANWRKSVHDGFIASAGEVDPGQPRAFTTPALSPSQSGGSVPDRNALEVTFAYSPFSYDGRFANNAWLQETPDFLSKVTWDNYAIVGPTTAEALKLTNDKMITVRVNDRELQLPCHTMPGQAPFSITLLLGGGRKAAGRVGGSEKDGVRVGWDTYVLRTTTGFDIALGGTATDEGGDRYTLASTQEHWDIRTLPYGAGLDPAVNEEGLQKRLPELIRETTAATLADPKWQAEPEDVNYWDDAKVNPPNQRRGLSLFREKEYAGRKWAMAIDLTTCTGCNSCMIACQNENNVPVVGRAEVINNREMHWIRIDRYFSGPRDEPVVVHQPMTCQQCENAPCEQVCPVGATSHSEEGLNDQAYNRCIGTRYCANNCPYKVRRFNFLDWNKEWREARNKVRRLLFNPEVTVRMRGVMEKCTFCVQRIQNAKIHFKAVARHEGGQVDSPLPDGSIVTACQQACPTQAIVFGDLSDPNSRVSRLHGDARTYDLLPELYTKPRTKYLARVRNPHPKLAKAPTKGEGAHE